MMFFYVNKNNEKGWYTLVSNRLCGHGALFMKMGFFGALGKLGGSEG